MDTADNSEIALLWEFLEVSVEPSVNDISKQALEVVRTSILSLFS